MTSKERIQATIRRQDVDHLPMCFEGLCFGTLRFLYDRWRDPIDRMPFYLERGLDAAPIIAPPSISDTAFETRSWTEQPAGEAVPLLCKEYITSAGNLRQVVRYTEDYDTTTLGPAATPGDVRLLSDHNVPPSRSVQYLVSGPEDLPVLEAMFQPPSAGQRADYFERAKHARRFCEENGLLMGGSLLGVGDVLFWLSGIEPILLWAMDQPESLQAYVDIVARWDLAKLELMVEAGVEYVVRRGWYETADFWSPGLFRQFLLAPLQSETALAHQADMIYAYCMNSGVDPLLDELLESGIDVLCNLDPMAARTDIAKVKSRIGDAITLCGGVNNQHIIQQGTAADVRAAVEEAVATLSPGGGYILAPADSLLDTGSNTLRNFDVMVDAWRQLCHA